MVYVQSGQQTLADYAAGTAASSPTYRYVWASYIDEPVLRVDSSNTKLYYHRNQQYSVVALTNSAGGIVERYAYTAYGEPTILSGSVSPQAFATHQNRYQYTAREWDEKLELYHYRARMYSPVAGRFVSRDPIGFEGSEWNVYEYVGAHPLIMTDPNGKSGWLPPFPFNFKPLCKPGPWVVIGCAAVLTENNAIVTRCMARGGGARALYRCVRNAREAAGITEMVQFCSLGIQGGVLP